MTGREVRSVRLSPELWARVHAHWLAMCEELMRLGYPILPRQADAVEMLIERGLDCSPARGFGGGSDDNLCV